MFLGNSKFSGVLYLEHKLCGGNGKVWDSETRCWLALHTVQRTVDCVPKDVGDPEIIIQPEFSSLGR